MGEGRGSTSSRRIGLWALLLAVALGAAGLTATREAARAVDVVVPGCAIDPNELVAWWKGEDSLTAEVGPDLTGPAQYEDGLIGRTFSIGAGGTLSVADFPELATAVSIDGWIRVDDTGRLQTIVTVGTPPFIGPGEFAYRLTVGPRGILGWQVDPEGGRFQDVVSARVPIHDGFYHHVAATYTAGGAVRLYFDGQLVASKDGVGGDINAVAGTPFLVGDGFEGEIDELGVHRVALTPAQVLGLRNAGPNGKCLPPTELVPGASGGVAGATARFKGENSGGEVYLGPMTNPSALPRVESGNQWSPGTVFPLTLGYSAADNALRATVTGTNGADLTWDFDVDGPPGCPVADWNVMDISMSDNRTDGGLRLVDITLDGEDFGNFFVLDEAGTIPYTTIHFRNMDFGADWDLAADLEIVGAFTGNENMKAQFTVGCLA